MPCTRRRNKIKNMSLVNAIFKIRSLWKSWRYLNHFYQMISKLVRQIIEELFNGILQNFFKTICPIKKIAIFCYWKFFRRMRDTRFAVLSPGHRMTLVASKVSRCFVALYDCWTTDIAVSVIALPSLQMLDDVVVCSDCAAATVGCLCSMWSRVFSMARNRFSRLVVPRMPTCSCGPSGRIANNHHVHDGPSGRRDQSSSVSGMCPNTRWISDFCEVGTVSHHLWPFARTCIILWW